MIFDPQHSRQIRGMDHIWDVLGNPRLGARCASAVRTVVRTPLDLWMTKQLQPQAIMDYIFIDTMFNSS